jgi:metal-sulfur cluster biosynthetic enzyme
MEKEKQVKKNSPVARLATTPKRPAGATSQIEQILEALRNVKDPEIGLDIVELGLIRKITIDDEEELAPRSLWRSGVEILMTLTSPFCPFADSLIAQVEKEAGKIYGAGQIRVEITFDPPWEPAPELKEKLGL